MNCGIRKGAKQLIKEAQGSAAGHTLRVFTSLAPSDAALPGQAELNPLPSSALRCHDCGTARSTPTAPFCSPSRQKFSVKEVLLCSHPSPHLGCTSPFYYSFSWASCIDFAHCCKTKALLNCKPLISSAPSERILHTKSCIFHMEENLQKKYCSLDCGFLQRTL